MPTTGYNGRDLTVSWDSTTLVGIRTLGISINNEPVDITTDDDGGWRTLLPDPGVRSVDVDVAGVLGDEILIAETMQTLGSGDHETVSVALPTGNGTLSFSAMASNFNFSKSHDGTVEFTGNLLSSGTVTYTASV